MTTQRSARPGAKPARAGRVSLAAKPAKAAGSTAGKAKPTAKAVTTETTKKTISAKTSVKAAKATKPAKSVKAPKATKPATAIKSAKSTKSAGTSARKKSAIKPTPAELSDPKANGDANVAKRNATLQRVTFRGDLRSVPTDPGDAQAIDGLAQQIARQDAAHAAADSPARPSARKKRSAVERLDDPEPAAGLVLIDRVSQSIERELCAIEKIIGVRPKKGERTETERRARTLASLARTLAEVRRLRSDEERKRPLDDDAIPRDLDELRRALSRRLEQMVASATQLLAAGDE
ncbi:hypothetical protein [Rhodopseudomonas pseudopalustris]|uniref:Uncharacterized protein n=1 Tax=Rhodopseudomonas pseudopalustris TaxID=1513892 RepID=A0A1H8S3G7_9BRAD|nr:hypothetical protein [Rhodopseudomonas pseudopalustris]SEO73086.1 hypothetical protein SAMN05444123_104242 [Rhodopseudomonas pseudopalustris]